MIAQVLHTSCTGATYARVQGALYRYTYADSARAYARAAWVLHTSLHTSVKGASS